MGRETKSTGAANAANVAGFAGAARAAGAANADGVAGAAGVGLEDESGASAARVDAATKDANIYAEGASSAAGGANAKPGNAGYGNEGSGNEEPGSAGSGNVGSGNTEPRDAQPWSAGSGTEGDADADPVQASTGGLASERDRYLRLAAEYDNFRKRSAKERDKIYSDARADAITRLLPVYDNLERALKMECADEAFYKGVEMTMTQLTEILEGMDVERIPAVGEPFDPNRHNAVMTITDPGLGEKIVAEEFQKGFILGERVIRHSTVVVAN